eukprot:jgi/Mesen1/6229/ME000320S05424
MEVSWRATRRLCLALVVQVALLSSSQVAVEAIVNPCNACLTVSVEFTDRIFSEKPKNHIDLRHRLDSQGKREGKVIDYRVSELRVVELMDSLCKQMLEYTLATRDDGARIWARKDDSAKLSERAKMVQEMQGKELGRWLLEEKEDELGEMIRKGEITPETDIDELICRNMTRHCTDADWAERNGETDEEEQQGGGDAPAQGETEGGAETYEGDETLPNIDESSSGVEKDLAPEPKAQEGLEKGTSANGADREEL